MIFWNRSQFGLSNVFVTINTLAQLAYVLARLPTMNVDSANSVLTHLVAKTFAGIGILDLLHNSSVAYFNHVEAPGAAVRALTGLGFAALALSSDYILGGSFVYDLIALAVGQRQYGNAAWGNLLALYAAGTAGLVGLRNWYAKPYLRDAGYEPLT